MSIKAIRNETGLTQKGFASKYQIPLQTLKQWESDPGSTSYRNPPDYVVYMLEKLVEHDFDRRKDRSVSREENLINAAEESRYNAAHWLRYLRKEFEGGTMRLSSEQLMKVLSSDRLTMYQKISLKRAATPETETHNYVVSLNERADTSMLDEIMRKHRNVRTGI